MKRIIKMFQFHIGAIKIKHCRAGKTDLLKFQFHIGAIKMSFFESFNINNYKFQFHIGAIKIKSRFRLKCSDFIVSIPYWCD